MNSNIDLNNNPQNKYRVAEYILAGLAIVFILAITGIFLWHNFQKTGNFIHSEKEKEKNVATKEDVLANLPEGITGKKENPPNIQEKEESDCGIWQKYVHPKAGYAVCIPQGWTVRESDYESQVVEKNVKYIEAFTPDKKFKLYLGFKKKTDDFAIGDRTGIGAGEDKKIGDITVLDQAMSVDGHYFEDEIREVFFGVTQPRWVSDLYEIYAYFNKTSDTYDPGKGIRLDELALKNAKKIMESITVTGKEASVMSGCPSAFTSSEKGIMENWQTYTDKKNKFSLRYPKGITVFKMSDDIINFNEKDGSTLFSVKSNVDAAADFYGYRTIGKDMVKIDCREAMRLTMRTDIENFPKNEKRKLISTQIDRERTRQRMEMNFPDLHSASLESDYFEIYDMVLKSIKFQK